MDEMEKMLLEADALFDECNSLLKDLDDVNTEIKRVHHIAVNTEEILDDLDRQFSAATGIRGEDFKFLFVAIALQCIRIYAVNEFTKIEKAGKGQREKDLHNLQDKLFENFDQTSEDIARAYYAPLKQIVTTHGVPYDATSFIAEKHDCFKGVNHRFGTLGHDPLLGLVFGTVNILTNTITCVNKPIVNTYHVVYNENFGTPKIGGIAPTSIALTKSAERLNGDIESVVAALIKVIIHTGTDIFTPCGLQLPGANLILSKERVASLTKTISAGDVLKVGVSYGIAELINIIISALHLLTYNAKECSSEELFSIRTKKIILYSNMIATGSNVIWVGVNVNAGNTKAIKDLDIAGIMVILQKLMHNDKFIREVKEEFIYGSYRNMIMRDNL